MSSRVDLKWRGDKWLAEFTRTLEPRMEKVALAVEGKIKQSVSRGNAGGQNPSAPGTPPKVVTGTLRSNIGHEVVNVAGREIVAAIGVRKSPASEYARRLELGFAGTDSAGRRYSQAPRPFLRPGLTDNRALILSILQGG